jgi:hypothetical protein
MPHPDARKSKVRRLACTLSKKRKAGNAGFLFHPSSLRPHPYIITRPPFTSSVTPFK